MALTDRIERAKRRLRRRARDVKETTKEQTVGRARRARREAENVDADKLRRAARSAGGSAAAAAARALEQADDRVGEVSLEQPGVSSARQRERRRERSQLERAEDAATAAAPVDASLSPVSSIEETHRIAGGGDAAKAGAEMEALVTSAPMGSSDGGGDDGGGGDGGDGNIAAISPMGGIAPLGMGSGISVAIAPLGGGMSTGRPPGSRADYGGPAPGGPAVDGMRVSDPLGLTQGMFAQPGSPLKDNPTSLDERDEIAAHIAARGFDPMNIQDEEDAIFAWSILNAWEDEPPSKRGGRTDQDVALEAERVEDRLIELGVNVQEPVEVDTDEGWL